MTITVLDVTVREVKLMALTLMKVRLTEMTVSRLMGSDIKKYNNTGGDSN